MNKLFSLLLLYCFSATLSAQTIKDIPGAVFDSETKEVLPGATITIYHLGRVAGLIANKEGKFAIPAGTNCDSLKVSMVGHRSEIYFTNKLQPDGTFIALLTSVPAALPEVIVKPVTGLEIMKRVAAKISVNQPQEDFENKGFYREIIKDKENYFSVAEALFTAQYSPVEKNCKLRLEQGRSKEDVAYTRMFEDFHPGGGPQLAAGSSLIAEKPAFLTLKELKNFIFKIDSLVQFDGHWLYHISFDQKPGIKEALDKGYILVDTDDDAVVKYDVHNSPFGTPYIKSLTGSDKIFAEILNIDIKRKGWTRLVDFTRVKNKWVMNHAETVYSMIYKQPKKAINLDLTISVELAFSDLYQPVIKTISKGEEWKKKNIVANLPTAFDSAFWGNNNIISPTAKVDSILSLITQSNHDLPPQTALAGWQYLNKNLFVSYSRKDSIILIPLMKSNWEDEISGALLFHEIDSNFSIESKINVVKNSVSNEMPDRGFQQAGIMIRSINDAKENYVFLSLGVGGNPNPKLFFKRTVDNKSKTVVDKKTNLSGWMRVEKAGKKIIAYFKEEPAAEYKKVGEYELDFLEQKLQVGLGIFAAFSGDGPKMKPDIKAVFSELKIVSL